MHAKYIQNTSKSMKMILWQFISVIMPKCNGTTKKHILHCSTSCIHNKLTCHKCDLNWKRRMPDILRKNSILSKQHCVWTFETCRYLPPNNVIVLHNRVFTDHSSRESHRPDWNVFRRSHLWEKTRTLIRHYFALKRNFLKKCVQTLYRPLRKSAHRKCCRHQQNTRLPGCLGSRYCESMRACVSA